MAVVEIPPTGDAELEVDGRRVAIHGLERPMWPVAGWTKADLLSYYARAAPLLLLHLTGRPLRLVRFPDGVHRRGIVDSELAGAPAVVDDLATLLEIADCAAVELHVPLGPSDDAPGWIQFDLEPGAGRGLVDVCGVALRLHRRLTQDGLAAHVKTTGAFGLHVAVPVNGGSAAAAMRAYARAVTDELAAEAPDLVTSDARRASRSRRVLVDWRPNVPGRWSLAPYSLRATLPGPGVSAPVTWEDVAVAAEGATEALERAPADVLDADDAWRPVLEAVQAIPGAG